MFKKIIELTRKLLKKTKKELKEYKFIYFLLTSILVMAFFIRTYRLEQLLGFYYDQGRDAQVIWELWHHGELFLIGPVTGLSGIFLGPFYYYLIAPFYILGGGNPVVPAVFLAFLVTTGIGIVYYLGWQMESRETGLIAAFISAFSYYMMLAGRWLSNPTPILLTSVLLFMSLWKISMGENKRWWIVVSLLVGLSLNFEAASAFFYIPIVVVFLIWRLFFNSSEREIKKEINSTGTTNKKRRNNNLSWSYKLLMSEFGNIRIFLASLVVFFITLLPQILFSFRHDNLLLNNFIDLFTQEKSFRIDIREVLKLRLNYFWSVFHSKILVGKPHYASFFTVAAFSGIVYSWRELHQRKVLQLFAIFLLVPAVGYILFQGNYGNIYDYYLTGYYHIFVLLFAIGLGILWKNNLGKLIVIIYFLLFIQVNLVLIRNYLIAGVDGPTHVSLGNEIQAVDWILDDAVMGGEFNIDFYVPPVIPHTYEYLMTWQGFKRCGEDQCGWERDKELKTVYVLFEQDPPHPERLEKWLSDRANNTEILEEETFGGITVQRRKRL